MKNKFQRIRHSSFVNRQSRGLMDTLLETNIRGHLRDRRQRLESAISEVGDAADLVRLLQEVDAALDRLENKSYGLCNVCNLAIEEEFLLANPLVQYCL